MSAHTQKKAQASDSVLWGAGHWCAPMHTSPSWAKRTEVSQRQSTRHETTRTHRTYEQSGAEGKAALWESGNFRTCARNFFFCDREGWEPHRRREGRREEVEDSKDEEGHRSNRLLNQFMFFYIHFHSSVTSSSFSVPRTFAYRTWMHTCGYISLHRHNVSLIAVVTKPLLTVNTKWRRVGDRTMSLSSAISSDHTRERVVTLGNFSTSKNFRV